jgi:hypothetical protein
MESNGFAGTMMNPITRITFGLLCFWSFIGGAAWFFA